MKTAPYFDAIHERLRDASRDADAVAACVREHVPEARTVLDVACGTGEHALRLGERHGFTVDGIDIDADAIDIARRKVPGARFDVADMRSFALGRTYDAVVSLCSSIGYMLTNGDLAEALASMARHCAPAGVVLVEPWLRPDTWAPGLPRMVTVDRTDLKVCRMSRGWREGNLSVIEFQFLAGDGRTTRHFVETHRLRLFTVDEMLAAFDHAGLDARHVPEGIFARGAYVARRR